MFTISAFADEIDADPQQQLDVLKSCNVRHIEFRSILKTNVLALSDLQIQEWKSMLEKGGFRLSAIGSPIGKVPIDGSFDEHLVKFKRAIELCKVFDTPNIRIFSYYPPQNGWDGNWAPWRNAIMNRLEAQVALAEKSGVRLFHENEHRIYGDAIERIVDLFTTINSPAFKAAYDPANFVFCGYDPWEGWEKSRDFTAHFHIKDWKKGAEHGSIPGDGDGQMARIIADATKRGYSGFAVMEPHLLGGGPTGGVTGPDLFPKAVEAFRNILDKAGAKHD